jgi:DNA repair photolyase
MNSKSLDIIEIPAKAIVMRTKSTSWFGAEYNMNIYRGCSHGCIYCDSRSDCYRNSNFDCVKVKKDALRVIQSDLGRIRRAGVVATGAMSDPYNPLEGELKLTRSAMRLLCNHGFGVAIATKSALVSRDIDVIRDIARRRCAIVKITVTTADDEKCKKIEPLVSTSSERFRALKDIAEAGIFCGVLMMPIMPFINDTPQNIVDIVRSAADCGASFVYPSFGLSMRSGQREYLYRRLDESFPGVRKQYERRYTNRYQCLSPDSQRLWDIFRTECQSLGVMYEMDDIVTSSVARYTPRQRELF